MKGLEVRSDKATVPAGLWSELDHDPKQSAHMAPFLSAPGPSPAPDTGRGPRCRLSEQECRSGGRCAAEPERCGRRRDSGFLNGLARQ